MVIKLFGPVGMAYVAPAQGPDRMIAAPPGRDGGAIPPGRGVFQEGYEALTVKILTPGQAANGGSGCRYQDKKCEA